MFDIFSYNHKRVLLLCCFWRFFWIFQNEEVLRFMHLRVWSREFCHFIGVPMKRCYKIKWWPQLDHVRRVRRLFDSKQESTKSIHNFFWSKRHKAKQKIQSFLWLYIISGSTKSDGRKNLQNSVNKTANHFKNGPLCVGSMMMVAARDLSLIWLFFWRMAFSFHTRSDPIYKHNESQLNEHSLYAVILQNFSKKTHHQCRFMRRHLACIKSIWLFLRQNLFRVYFG